MLFKNPTTWYLCQNKSHSKKKLNKYEIKKENPSVGSTYAWLGPSNISNAKVGNDLKAFQIFGHLGGYALILSRPKRE